VRSGIGGRNVFRTDRILTAAGVCVAAVAARNACFFEFRIFETASSQ
jgi:hypothetical protein